MADAFVGLWRGTRDSVENLNGFLEAVGKPGEADAFSHDFSLDIKKEGKKLNIYTKMDNVQQNIDQATGDGIKVQTFLPGIGMLEMDCVFKGGKFCNTGTHNGQPIYKNFWIEGDVLKAEMIYGGQIGLMMCCKA